MMSTLLNTVLQLALTSQVPVTFSPVGNLNTILTPKWKQLFETLEAQGKKLTEADLKAADERAQNFKKNSKSADSSLKAGSVWAIIFSTVDLKTMTEVENVTRFKVSAASDDSFSLVALEDFSLSGLKADETFADFKDLKWNATSGAYEGKVVTYAHARTMQGGGFCEKTDSHSGDVKVYTTGQEDLKGYWIAFDFTVTTKTYSSDCTEHNSRNPLSARFGGIRMTSGTDAQGILQEADDQLKEFESPFMSLIDERLKSETDSNKLERLKLLKATLEKTRTSIDSLKKTIDASNRLEPLELSLNQKLRDAVYTTHMLKDVWDSAKTKKSNPVGR